MGAQPVKVVLSGDPEFKEQSHEVESRLARGKKPLRNLKRRVSWTLEGFTFENFDIHPTRYFADPLLFPPATQVGSGS